MENADLKRLLDVRLKGTVSCRKVFGIDKPLTRRPYHSRDLLLKTIRGHIALSYVNDKYVRKVLGVHNKTNYKSGEHHDQL